MNPLLLDSAPIYLSLTMDKSTTHGRLSRSIRAIARDVFPDPELPAIPMMLVFAHGG
jgi:hypothetical protein